jgi:hypothetical protein
MSSPEVALNFEDHFDRMNEAVTCVFREFEARGDLQKVFIQFQSDAENLPNSIRGMKIGRYSAKKRHVEGYIQIARKQFEATDETERQRFLVSSIVQVLEAIAATLEKKASNNISDAITRLREVQWS